MTLPAMGQPQDRIAGLLIVNDFHFPLDMDGETSRIATNRTYFFMFYPPKKEKPIKPVCPTALILWGFFLLF
jgi:hypothetical protein